MSKTYQFLIIDTLFERYKIVVEPISATTSVYCEECRLWVAQYEGDQITTHTQDELYEKIVESHSHDFATRVEIMDDRKI